LKLRGEVNTGVSCADTLKYVLPFSSYQPSELSKLELTLAA
jgi:hypothetical protein